MKRMGGKGTDVVTSVHKLVAVAWIVGAVAVLVLVVPMRQPSAAGVGDAWTRVGIFQRVASVSSVATLLVGLVYGIWTAWGFVRHRWVVAKWLLFLTATGFAGPGISAARARSVGAVAAWTAAEIVVLAAAVGIGVFLERSRHSGRLAGS